MNLLGLINTLGKLFDRLSDSKDYSETLKNLKIDNVDIDLAAANGNMIKVMKNHIVEPTIFVSKNSYSRTDIDIVLENTTDIYAAFYIQVFKILMNVHNLGVNQTLSILASHGFDYEHITVTDNGNIIDLESIESLTFDVEDVKVNTTRTAKSISDDGVLSTKTIVRTLDIVLNTKQEATSSTAVDPNGDPLKMNRDVTISVPIVFKATVNVVELSTIINSVSHRGSDASFFKRMLQYFIGIISARELLLCGDLVKKYKEGALAKENFSSQINSSTMNNLNINNLLDKKLGLNKTVFSYVITDSELEMMTKQLGYKMRGSDKDKMMDALLALNITSIDEDRDRVSIYLNGISGLSTVAIKKLSKGGGSDTDALEMMVTALLSNRPIF